MFGEEAKVTICACRLCVPYPLIRRVLVHAALLEVGEGARGATAVQRANIAPGLSTLRKTDGPSALLTVTSRHESASYHIVKRWLCIRKTSGRGAAYIV